MIPFSGEACIPDAFDSSWMQALQEKEELR